MDLDHICGVTHILADQNIVAVDDFDFVTIQTMGVRYLTAILTEWKVV